MTGHAAGPGTPACSGLMTVAWRNHCALIGPVNRRRDSQLPGVVVGHIGFVGGPACRSATTGDAERSQRL